MLFINFKLVTSGVIAPGKAEYMRKICYEIVID